MATAFTHATLLDGTEHMEPQPNMTVLVDDAGIISDVGPSATLDVPVGTPAVDLAGRYLMPGLVNMHVHLCGVGKPLSSSGAANIIDLVTGHPLGRAYLKRQIRASAACELMSGTTTVRSVGDPSWKDIEVRDEIRAGRYLGPRLLSCGWGVTPENGHGRGLIAQTCATPEDARALVREIFAHGADLVKLFITGGVFDAEKPGEPGLVRMSLAMAQATVDEAHKLGLPTATHVESADGVKLALMAGVDTIEHGAPMTDEIIELFRRNGCGRRSSLTTTISPAIPLARMPREKTHSTEVVAQNAGIVFRGIVECSKQALAAGIPVGLGTDSGCPYVTHYDMWRELVYFHDLVGVSNAFALHTATEVNSRILGLGEVCGRVAPGLEADLIACRANPLEDLSALRHVGLVCRKGHLVQRPHVKRLPALDRELDAVLHAEA